MTEIILLLYMQEEEYGRRMLRFFARKNLPCIYPELVTSSEMLRQRVGGGRQSIVVLTDREELDEEEKKEKQVIFLSGVARKNTTTIFQYQKAEKIYEELMTQLGRDGEETAEPVTFQPEKKGIWFVMSPDAVGVTAVSTMAAQYLGRQGTCLYLSLSGFPVWYEGELREQPDFGQKGIGDLVFMSNRKEFVNRERELRKQMGSAFLLAPFHHYKDLLDSTKEDWEELFCRLKEDCGYETIVVELGVLMEHTLELLTLGDEIIFLSQSGLLGSIRRNVWKQYCKMEGKEEVCNNTKWVKLPNDWQEWEEMITGQPLNELAQNNQLMAKIGSLLESDEGEDENVCLLENIR